MTSDQPTILITGANGALDRQTARAAAGAGAQVLCAGRDMAQLQHLADTISGQAVQLDLTSLDSVRAAGQTLGRVDAVACVAGVQLVRDKFVTVDGFEQTFQVNHLAQLALVDALLDRPEPPGTIAFIGSATHDPAVRTGTPDPLDLAVDAIADDSADPDDDARTAGLRRYTTSKLLTIATALGLARERRNTSVYAFDPGLMPATGLARDFPMPFRIAWNTVLRASVVLPFASSPRTSGRALATLLSGRHDHPSGHYVDYKLEPRDPSARAQNIDFQDDVITTSRALIAERTPSHQQS